ncbi:MAG: hypothetical protein ABEI86_13435, partial [Halobacteriaceae archaeon]
WAIASDYDGRFDRNLTAVRLQEWKYLFSESDGELYNLTEPEVTDQSKKVLPIAEELRKLATQRVKSEEEQLIIREFSEELF